VEVLLRGFRRAAVYPGVAAFLEAVLADAVEISPLTAPSSLKTSEVWGSNLNGLLPKAFPGKKFSLHQDQIGMKSIRCRQTSAMIL
jgi:hypothetical protein